MKYQRSLLRLLAILIGILPGVLVFWWAADREEREIPSHYRTSSDLERFAESADIRVLMVGNSLTHYNQLDQLFEKLAEAAPPGGIDICAVRITPGGYNLAQHRSDLLDEHRDPVLRKALVSGPEGVRAWDFVVLQEQSQTPGFDSMNPEWRDLSAAAATIHDIAAKGGATTVLLMTWGFWNGDFYHLPLYPDFMTMSRRLEAGYLLLAGQLASSSANRCLVAPAGVAFRAVFEEEHAMGIDPKAKGSLFRGLYADDRHPTLAGSYLAAAVLVGTILAVPVEPATWVPHGLDPDVAARLRRIADDVVRGSDRKY